MQTHPPAESTKKPIRLLLVDDHEVVRVGLRTVFSHYPQIEVVGDAANSAEAASRAATLQPDVVLLDVRLPDSLGPESCRRVRTASPSTRIIALTSFSDDDTVMQTLKAGANGYLLKEVNSAALVDAIERVASGQSVLDPAVTARVLGRVGGDSTPSPRTRIEQLSAQERRVLAGVAEGKTNKEIALDLGLSDKTVKNYFSSVLEKLELSRRSQAAAFYVQHMPQTKP